MPGFVVLLAAAELDSEAELCSVLSIKSMLQESSTEHRWCLADSQLAYEADELADESSSVTCSITGVLTLQVLMCEVNPGESGVQVLLDMASSLRHRCSL